MCGEALGEALAGLEARAEAAAEAARVAAEKAEAEAEAAQNAPPPPPPAPSPAPGFLGGVLDGLFGGAGAGAEAADQDERSMLEKVTTSVLNAEWYVGPLDQVPTGSWAEVRACVQSASTSLTRAGVVCETCRTARGPMRG